MCPVQFAENKSIQVFIWIVIIWNFLQIPISIKYTGLFCFWTSQWLNFIIGFVFMVILCIVNVYCKVYICCLICLWCNIQLHLVEFWEKMMIVVNLSRHVWDHWNCFGCVVFVNSFFINSAQCWCTCMCINDVFNLFPF